MDNNKQNPQASKDNNWLDEVLGTKVPKAVSPKELAELHEAAKNPPKPKAAFQDPAKMTSDVSDAEFMENLKNAGSGKEVSAETIVADLRNAEDQAPVSEPTKQIPGLPDNEGIRETPFGGEQSPLTPIHTDARIGEGENNPTPLKPSHKQRKAPANNDWRPVPVMAEPENLSRRPKPKGGYGLLGIPHIVSTFVWLIVIVICGVTLGRTLWVCCADLLAFGKEDLPISVTITDEDVKVNPDGTKEVDADTISKKLADAGLIKYPDLFKLFITATDKDQDIIAGTFTLNCYYDYNAMVNAMSYYAPAREEVTVTIPEGYTCAQIFKLLEENNVCTIEELEEYAANGELQDYWFLEDVERGHKYSLEGFLFPDTYDFYTYDEPKRVLEKFLDAFDYRFTDLMKEDLANLQTRYGTEFSVHDIVILASIIEKETSSASESYDIASVFYNRLTDPNFYPRYLGADATVHYAIGDYYGQIQVLTQAHLDTDSPYNTRKYAGIPPGAISSPGRDSLYAALDPNYTNYLYFVYDPEEGCHLFTNSYSQHLENIAKVGKTP